MAALLMPTLTRWAAPPPCRSVPDLSVFSSAIATTTLGDLLSDPNAGPFTVFAPRWAALCA